MEKLRVGIVGCGGRGRAHAVGYTYAQRAEIVACADPVEPSRAAFAERFGAGRAYADYREMLEKEELDIVSNCTWTPLHTAIVEAAAERGVRAIHSEKPMAPTWGEARRQHRVCAERGVQLTYCHQRRFHLAFVRARQLLRAGAVGPLQRLEGSCPNLFDWGTHWFDMFFYYNGDEPARAVIGQLDARGSRPVFDVPVEGGGLSWIQWQNGVQGLMVTGRAGDIGCHNRIVGEDGLIELRMRDGAHLRLLRPGEGWTEPGLEGTPFEEEAQRIAAGVRHPGRDEKLDLSTSTGLHVAADVLAIIDVVESLEEGREPELSSRRALQATELIFATYESSRRRAQVDLPLEGEDSAFLALLEAGALETGEAEK